MATAHSELNAKATADRLCDACNGVIRGPSGARAGERYRWDERGRICIDCVAKGA